MDNGKVEYSTIEKIIPQYVFGLGGSFKLKKLVEYIEGAQGTIDRITQKAANKDSYKIG